VDYLKKIQDALEKAEQDKQELFKYLSQGTVSISGRGRVIAIYRDQPGSKIVVANNPPLTLIRLDLPHIFSKGASNQEISSLEDYLFLNDVVSAGNYQISAGVRARYVQTPAKTTSGNARVKFVSGGGKINMVTRDDKHRQQDDDAVILGMLPRSFQDQEEEELRLLGLLD
jgi:hypothetical protein